MHTTKILTTASDTVGSLRNMYTQRNENKERKILECQTKTKSFFTLTFWCEKECILFGNMPGKILFIVCQYICITVF